MHTAAVIERVRRVAGASPGTAATPDDLRAALTAASELRAWLAGAEAALGRQLAQHVSFPEQAIAECTRSTLAEAAKGTERAATLEQVPALADALDRAAITSAHVDALTRAGKGLDDHEQRTELFERAEGLVDMAASATVDEFRRRLALEVRSIRTDDGMARLERQRRDARLRTWTDDQGMWRVSGRFDPVAGVGIAARLDAAVEALFSETTPPTCPADPVEKQSHLRALAFARLTEGDPASPRRPGRREVVVVIDSSTSDGAGGPDIDWGIPVEIPGSVLADLAGDADVTAVVVRNGVVIHAPGQLDLGRTTRLANRAQRRALRAMYRGCAIPGCTVAFERCKIHHVTWWRNGGRTDLENLLPVCAHHHARVHEAGWELSFGPNRELTIRFPDGTVRNTGPPTRRAA